MACRPLCRFDFALMSHPDATGLQALRTPRQWVIFGALAVVSVVFAHLLDETVWRSLRDARIYEKDLGRMLRLMGFLPVWLVIAIGLWMHDRPSPGWGWRGGLAILSPTAGGAAAEVLKILVRRLRPDSTTFGYLFRPFSEDPFSSRGLGMPSSHAMVAFAGAAALARIFPRAWWLWYLLAAGCIVTRMLALGHFLSDTIAGALLGYVIGVLLSRAGGFGRRLHAPSSTPISTPFDTP